MLNEIAMLDRVRKLLAKAEDAGVTAEEGEALTAKAAELMARYGIDRARLAAAKPETDKPGSRIIDIANPWARVRAHLLSGLAGAMRCQCIMLNPEGAGARVHIFGYESDLERTDILYTSLLLQMAHGLARARVPAGAQARTWRRSWLLGYISAVIERVKAAEQGATDEAASEDARSGTSTALVLADRSAVISRAAAQVYPETRTARLTYRGTGYRTGYARGQEANIGGTSVRGKSQGELR